MGGGDSDYFGGVDSLSDAVLTSIEMRKLAGFDLGSVTFLT